MIAVLITGGLLVILTSILAARSVAFWALPITIAVATVLFAGLIHFGSPQWSYLVAGIIAVIAIVGTVVFASMRWLLAAGLAVITAIALLTTAFATGSPLVDTKTNAATLASKLTVSPEDILPTTVKCESDAFLDNSRAAVDANNPALRTWSYSVSTPFGSSDPTVILDKMFAENCGNPTVLDMNIQWLDSLDIQGFKVGAANPWMGKHLAQASNPGLRSSYLTKKTGELDSKIFVTADYQSVAAMVNFLLSRFDVIGVGSWQSTTNWHLDGAGMVVGELPRTSLNPNQENLPALRLELTDKGVGCVFAGGFNTADKRWEQFNCLAPTTPPTATTTTSTTVPPANYVPPTTKAPTTKPPTTTVPTPTPPKVCPPKTHGVWPVCKDDSAVDPQNQGNNKVGGGGKAPVQTDPVGPPAAGNPPVAYTKPAAPAPAAPAVPIGAIPDPAPAPAPEPAAPAPAAPAPAAAVPGTSCAPGIPTC